KLARQAYRYDRRYRLAALILIAAALLQVPFPAVLYYGKGIMEEQESRRGLALRKQAQITEELGALKEPELQLRRIKSWEPILRGRMPGSAVLGSVEQTIPQDVVLSRIVMEAANYRSVLLSRGSFRVPQTYTITLE